MEINRRKCLKPANNQQLSECNGLNSLTVVLLEQIND
jgi:hypothetical protein